jgi:hypothetical protein
VARGKARESICLRKRKDPSVYKLGMLLIEQVVDEIQDNYIVHICIMADRVRVS